MAFTQAELYADRSASEPGLAERKAPRSQPTTAQVLLLWLGHRSTGFARGVVKAMAQEQPNAWKASGWEHKSESCLVHNRCPAVGRPERGTCLAACINPVLQRGGTPPRVLSATVGSVGRHPFLSRKLPHCPTPGRTRRRLRRTVGRFAPVRKREPPRLPCGPPERPDRG